MSQPLPPPTGVVMHVTSAPAFKCDLEHGPSGARFVTEAPKDNGGTGGSFSPTDLVGAALASCVVTTMALVASREGLSLGDVRATVEKRMTPPPRRIGELVLAVHMPAGLSRAHRARMEEIAHGCPVSRSLHPDVGVHVTFHYPDEPREG